MAPNVGTQGTLKSALPQLVSSHWDASGEIAADFLNCKIAH